MRFEPDEEESGFPDVVDATVLDSVSVDRDRDGREAWGVRDQVMNAAGDPAALTRCHDELRERRGLVAEISAGEAPW